ncbi:BatD family protein [Lysobacter silvisoli]|uniref:Protein BatD n=1 Tax=Lysobacter silvisoli TaxID=2293254 RepID=A0A371JZC7_9GAMM|nr:BatD family protein [Lysobacter silvisoli]RDZ26984.1 protein BatD [Lysobacter silvisoli]
MSTTPQVSSRFLARCALALLLALAAFAVGAQPRAWLDRDTIGVGETVTLNIETTAVAGGGPDYAPLRTDFEVSNNTSRRSFERVNGRYVTRSLFGVALRPRRDGRLSIPSIVVGNERTAPLTLVVTPASAQVPARAGDDVFIESQADAADPYVQQAVGWVVRLYAAVPIVAGQLDQPAPEGASFQRVGDDAQYSREIGGRRYNVVERRYLLVPERSGPLTVPGARFEGRGAPSFLEDMFGGNGDNLRTAAAPRRLQVKAMPANAPQPWLPLRDLQLRYQSTPPQLRAGSAATLTVELSADGATAAQLPELQLPPIDGVQVFADPAQSDESFVGGRPRVKLTRKFSLVPTRTGATRLDGLRLGWWDVGAGAPRNAELPPLQWTVAAADGSAPASPAVPAASGESGGKASPIAAIAQDPSARWWALAALVFAALWLATLVWALHLRAHPRVAPRLARPATSGAVAAAAATGAEDTTLSPPSGGRRGSLKQLLDTGDFGEIEAALCALARPPAADLDAVLARLADPAQREALQAMQRARWGGGDAVAARAQLRSAFAPGPRWRDAGAAPASPLPPLYPPG